jgi:ornithine cyclodeaminase/alanine dehydrogenase-like protein (mu-crystallin family)
MAIAVLEMKELTKILYLSRSEIEGILNMKDVIERVEKIFRLHAQNKVMQPQKTPISLSTTHYFHSLPCYLEGMAAGIKWYGANFSNRKKRLPILFGSIIINDPETCGPLCIMDSSLITEMRTGAQAGIGAKYLANKDSSIVAMIGCGHQARTHLEALDCVLKIDEVRAFDILKKVAKRYKEDTEDRLDVKVIPVSSAKEAVEGADIICMVTAAFETVVFDEWVGPGNYVHGTHLFHDLDPKLSKTADKWVLGYTESDIVAVLGHPKLAPKLRKSDVYGDLTEILTGKKAGREREDERIVYTHAGMGSLDVGTGLLAYEKALHNGVGTRLEIF